MVSLSEYLLILSAYKPLESFTYTFDADTSAVTLRDEPLILPVSILANEPVEVAEPLITELSNFILLPLIVKLPATVVNEEVVLPIVTSISDSATF